MTTPTPDPGPANPLATKIAAVLADDAHFTSTVYTDFDQVPLASRGFFHNNVDGVYESLQAKHLVAGWFDHADQPVDTTRWHTFTAFASRSEITERLQAALMTALVPPGHLLVAFAAETYTEIDDWESGGPSHNVTDLAKPLVLAHSLTEGDLARFYYTLEAEGTLGGESDAYRDLDTAIEAITEPAATRQREAAAAHRAGAGLFNLTTQETP